MKHDKSNKKSNTRRLHRLLILGLAGAVVVSTMLMVPLVTASARPGGGHRYSGGSRRSSSRSSGGGFSSSRSRRSSSRGGYTGGYRSSRSGGFLGIGGGSGCGMSSWMQYILIAIAIAVVGGFSLVPKLMHGDDDWASGGNVAWGAPPPPPPPDLSGLRKYDPHFSSIVLEDFLYNLYVRTMEARGTSSAGGKGGLDALAPYLSKQVRSALANRGNRPVQEVTGVIVGGQKVTSLMGLESDTVTISVEFESNYTEIYPTPAGQKQPQPLTFYTRERWTLTRSKSAKSRKPNETHTFNCPNCGAPVEGSQDEKCDYCDSFFNSGEFDWFVTSAVVLSEEPRGPLLTGTVEEKGTTLPTIFHPQKDKVLEEIKEHEPDFDWNSFQERVNTIFMEMNESWTNLTWDKVRPFVTDRFFLGQTYWIQAYQSQGLRNVLTNFRINRTEFTKAITDPYYDAITMRVYAAGIDYTMHIETNRVVSGNPKSERTYTEYWTLIRSRKDKEGTPVERTCPACGAPLDANSSSNCGHCGSKVAGDVVEWVLSRVEQDESYTG